MKFKILSPTIKRTAILVAVIVWLVISVPASLAQSDALRWSIPEKIYENRENVSEMALVADQLGGLHLFWNPLNTGEIYYSNWDGQSWSLPIDVVSSSQPRAPSVTVDSLGYLHLIWQDANNTLYYSQAKADSAGIALAWSPPVEVADSLTHANITVGPNDNLYIVYPGQNNLGPGIVISEDGGLSWSDSFPVSITSQPEAVADYTRAAVSQDGTIHVVWSEYQLPSGWPPLGSFYSQSKDGGTTWSPAVRISDENYHQTTIAVYKDQVVHVAYNGAAGYGGRYHRYSEDGGRTWSEPFAVIASGLGGSESPPQLALDANGNLHLATTYGQRVWYSVFQGQRWTEPVYVPTGDETGIPPVGQNIDANKDRFIERVVMALNLGNRLHMVFWDLRPARKVLAYWYTHRETSAAPIPAQPFPTPLPTLTPQNASLTTPIPTPTSPIITDSGEVTLDRFGIRNTGWPVLLAVLPVFLILAIIITSSIIRINRK
jgi:hypothetical protein